MTIDASFLVHREVEDCLSYRELDLDRGLTETADTSGGRSGVYGKTTNSSKIECVFFSVEGKDSSESEQRM